MQLQLLATGNLGGGEAAAIDARIDGSEITSGDAGAQLHARASLHPWAPQPAQQMDADFDRLNAHAFHDRAPVTDLSGRATLQPVPDADSQTWNFVLELANGSPGAWDRQLLPLRSFAARGQLDREQLRIESAQAELAGNAAAGRFTLAGTMPLRQPARSTGQLQLEGIDLRAMMWSLPRSGISGRISTDGNQAHIDIHNALPGPADRERLPLDQLLADIEVSPELWRTGNLTLRNGDGALQLQGQFAPASGDMDLRAELRQFPAAALDSRLAEGSTSVLAGSARINGNLRRQLRFDVDITGNGASTDAGAARSRGPWEVRAVQGSGAWSPTSFTLARLHLDGFQAAIDGSDIEVALPGMDSIKARISATAPGLALPAASTSPCRRPRKYWPGSATCPSSATVFQCSGPPVRPASRPTGRATGRTGTMASHIPARIRNCI
jgi:autotransporter translocation and assembly factor TamB